MTISLCGLPVGAPVRGSERATHTQHLALLRVGFTEPSRLPGMLVVSYTTVSPLPVPRTERVGAKPSAVCSLWHFPSDHSDWPLASTLPCGAPTFLDTVTRMDASPRSPSGLTVERPLCPIGSRTGW